VCFADGRFVAVGADAGATSYIVTSDGSYCFTWIDPDTHKVKIAFCGPYFTDAQSDVKLAWTESDEDLYETLGFDGSADDTNTDDYPVFTADHQHAYGWYSDEDGQLEDMPEEDHNIVNTMQSTSLSGRTKSQLVGDRYVSSLALQFLERALNGKTKVFSRGVAYGEQAAYPYERNQPLECWWMEARKGTRFRVYASGQRTSALALSEQKPTVLTDKQITAAGVTLDTDPLEWDECLFCIMGSESNDGSWMPDGAETNDVHITYRVATHTSTVVTFDNAHPSGIYPPDSDGPMFVLRQRYQTYVVDLDEMSVFAPDDIPGLDRYNIEIPLKRYVA
jgi:hypothetical protein